MSPNPPRRLPPSWAMLDQAWRALHPRPSMTDDERAVADLSDAELLHARQQAQVLAQAPMPDWTTITPAHIQSLDDDALLILHAQARQSVEAEVRRTLVDRGDSHVAE